MLIRYLQQKQLCPYLHHRRWYSGYLACCHVRVRDCLY